MDKNEQYHFEMSDVQNGAVISILHGEAERFDYPSALNITGSITAPARWAGVRKPDKLKDHVIYNKDERLIEFYFDDRSRNGGKVSGQLVVHPDLNYLCINDNKMSTLTELATKLKFSRRYFADNDEHPKIISTLMNFKASIKTDLEQNSDQRGNSKQLKDKKVESNVPTQFNLNIPLFIGEEPKSFTVEVCFDTTDAGSKVWLESVDMADLMISERERIMNAELDKLRAYELVLIEE